MRGFFQRFRDRYDGVRCVGYGRWTALRTAILLTRINEFK